MSTTESPGETLDLSYSNKKLLVLWQMDTRRTSDKEHLRRLLDRLLCKWLELGVDR